VGPRAVLDAVVKGKIMDLQTFKTCSGLKFSMRIWSVGKAVSTRFDQWLDPLETAEPRVAMDACHEQLNRM